MWQELDPLSQKAVAAAYHNGGYLDEDAFVAQYGARPWRRGSGIFYSYKRDPLPLDLFLYQKRLPQELMVLLAPFVPPPEKFQLEGLDEVPDVVRVYGEEHPLRGADTEQAGLYDLQVHLRLFQQGVLKYTPTSELLTAPSARILLKNLLEGDFLPYRESPKLADTIRPFGLDIFVRESGLVRNRQTRKLTDEGEALLRHQDTEALLYAFETWASRGKFDELSRIPAFRDKNPGTPA